MAQVVHHLGVGECSAHHQTGAGSGEHSGNSRQHEQRHQHHQSTRGRKGSTCNRHRLAAYGAQAVGRRAPQHIQALARAVHQRECRPLQQGGYRKVQSRAAPDQLHDFEHHIGQAEGHQQLRHMAERMDPAQTQALKQRAQHTDRQRGK